MKIHELIAALQYEVQKSFEFAENSVKLSQAKSGPSLHISVESMEVELPVKLSEIREEINLASLKDLPASIQKFRLPFTVETAIGKDLGKRKTIKGTTIDVAIVSPDDSKSDDLGSETIGRIKLVLKPVFK